MGVPGEIDVATATRWQFVSVVATLTEAFAADPFFTWVFPDPTQRVERLHAWWQRMLARRPPGSRTWQAAGAVSAALWYPPSNGDSPLDPGFDSWFVDLSGDENFAAERLTMFAELDACRPAEPCWYLCGVGTRPEHQGRGLGGMVLEPMLGLCEREGVPAYLESSNPRNVAFYERLGFVVLDTVPLPDGSSVITRMVYRPSGSGRARFSR